MLLDELLWTFRQDSFVPHEIVDGGGSADAPVTIGCSSEAPQADLLINLGSGRPDFAAHFERIAEIVDGSTDGREAARQRFRDYREAGHPLNTHHIGA